MQSPHGGELVSNCYSARRFDADRHTNSLIPLAMMGQTAAPNDKRERDATETTTIGMARMRNGRACGIRAV